MTDVVVIGAGPAGCAAAMLLARHDVSVMLVEQHRFPRDKVCGECLSAMGIDVLERLGLLDSVGALEPVLLTHSAVHAACGRSVRVQLPRPMWGLSRAAFDSTLLDRARGAGATVRQPARCEGIVVSPESGVRIRDLGTNEVRSVAAGHVIVADGKGALIPGTAPHTGDFGIKAHFIKVDGPRETIELFGCRGLYGGVAAIEGGRWNVAFSVPADRLRRFSGDVAAVFDGIVGENPVLRERMRNAQLVGEWIVSPLPRFGVRRSWPAGVIPIGNAAAAIEPIGGEGMGLALRSAEVAVESLALMSHPSLPLRRKSKGERVFSIGNRNADPILARQTGTVAAEKRERLRSSFASLWRIRAIACRAGAIATSRPAVARVLVPLLNIRMVAHAVFRLTGKT